MVLISTSLTHISVAVIFHTLKLLNIKIVRKATSGGFLLLLCFLDRADVLLYFLPLSVISVKEIPRLINGLLSRSLYLLCTPSIHKQ